MEVPPVDERHFDRGAAQPEDSLEPAETASDDDDSVHTRCTHRLSEGIDLEVRQATMLREQR